MNNSILDAPNYGKVPRRWLERASAFLTPLHETTTDKPRTSNGHRSYTVRVDQLSGKLWALVVYLASYDPSFRGYSLNLVHTDTTCSKDYPLGQLAGLPCIPETYRSLILGSMSGRHRELDFLVTAYLHTNSALSGALRSTDIEARCAETTVKALSEIANTVTSPTLIELILTGLQPMVLGTCRGLIEFYSKQPASQLLVRLRYFRGATLSRMSHSPTGKLTPESPGAKLEDYFTGPLWG